MDDDSISVPPQSCGSQEDGGQENFQLLKWPATRRIELAEKLIASVEDLATPEIEEAWNGKIVARVREIREGRAEGIPAEEVMKEARKKLHEGRRAT